MNDEHEKYSEYPATIMRALKELDWERDKILGMVAAATVAETVIAELGMTGEVSAHTHRGGCHILINDPKEGIVADMLKRLAAKGYRQKCDPRDCPDSKARVWNCGLIGITAYFHGAGATCQFVKVGEEMKPIYELRCDEKNSE